MAGVVPNLIDMWRYDFGKSVIFLEINRKIGCRLGSNLRKCGSILLAIDCNANYVSSSVVHQLNERDGCFDVSCFCRGH
jgi:hypothetical protein